MAKERDVEEEGAGKDEEDTPVTDGISSLAAEITGKPEEEEDPKGKKDAGSKKAPVAPKGKPSARKSSGDPLGVLAGDGLTDEGRNLAGAIRHIQSISDSRAARLEGQISQLTASMREFNHLNHWPKYLDVRFLLKNRYFSKIAQTNNHLTFL